MHGKQTRTSNAFAEAAADDTARQAIRLALAELGQPVEHFALAVGASPSYLRRYLDRGMPETLPAEIRRRLCVHLGLPEQALQ